MKTTKTSPLTKKINDTIKKLTDSNANIDVFAVSIALNDLHDMYRKSTSQMSRMKLYGAIDTILCLLPGGDC